MKISKQKKEIVPKYNKPKYLNILPIYLKKNWLGKINKYIDQNIGILINTNYV